MRARQARGLLGLFGVAGGAALLASPAWACSQNPLIKTTAGSALPGSEVPVRGEDWTGPDSAVGPVELRWNSKVGAPVASAAGVSFLVQVPVPSGLKSGWHVLVAQQHYTTATGNLSLWQKSLTLKINEPVALVEAEAPPAVVETTETAGEEPVAPDPVEEDTLLPEVTPLGQDGPVIPIGSVPSPPGLVVQNPTTPTPLGSGPPGPGPGPGPIVQGGASPSGSGSSGVSGSPRTPDGFQALDAGRSFSTDDGMILTRQRTDQRSAAVGEGGQPLADPSELWSEPVDGESTPSLFEPVEGAEAVAGSSPGVGAGLLGLSLMAVLGVGVVAGQRRLASIRSSRI